MTSLPTGVELINRVWIILLGFFGVAICLWLFTVLDSPYPSIASGTADFIKKTSPRDRTPEAVERVRTLPDRVDRKREDKRERKDNVSCTERGDKRPYCWHWENVEEALAERDYLSAWGRCRSVRHLLGEEEGFWSLCRKVADGLFPPLVSRVKNIRDGHSFQAPRDACKLLLEMATALPEHEQSRYRQLCDEANAAARDPKRQKAVRPDCERAAKLHAQQGGKLNGRHVSEASATIGPDGGVVGLDSGILLPVPPRIGPSPLTFRITPAKPEGELMENEGWETLGASFQVTTPVANSNNYALCVYGGALPAGRTAKDLMLLVGSWGISERFEATGDNGAGYRKASSKTYRTTPRNPDQIQGRFALFKFGPSLSGPAVFQPALRRR